MGITLTSKAINSTYDSLLKLSDNDQLTGAFKVITDGLGNDTGISINNTNQVNIAGQLVVNSSITANSFVKSGGLSSQFLKADGSVDSNTYQSVHQKGLANGYAPLDSGAKISEAYLPDSIVGQLEYQGTWNASTNTPTLPSASTVKGHYYVTSAAGTYETIEYAIGDWVISNGTSWEKVDNTDAVTTVFGRIGAIVANSNDYSSFYHPLNGDLAANASTATTLQTARFINGTSFNGSANITTSIWGTSRTITIGDTGKSLNGSTNVTWTRAELGITKTNIDALNIDADTLDGEQGTYYAAASSLDNYLPLTGGNLTGDLNLQYSGSIYSRAIKFQGAGASAYEIAIRANGEGLEIYEPEDANKVWLTISDDPSGNSSALQVNSAAGMTPVITDYNKNSYITKTYIDGLNVDADTLDGYDSSVLWKKGNDIPSGADLNTYTTDGYYHQNGNAAAAAGTNYPEDLAGMLSVQSDGNMVYQTYQVYNSLTNTYRRGYYNGTWYSWKRILMDNDNVNADLLDGLDSTQFLRSDADDNTGSAIKTYFGGAIMSSGARIQVNGFQRTGNIYLHSGGTTPDLIRTDDSLSNVNGDLHWTKAGIGTGEVFTSFNYSNYITKTYVDGLNVDADTLDGFGVARFIKTAYNHSYDWQPTGVGNFVGSWHGPTGGGDGFISLGSTTNNLNLIIDGDFYAQGSSANRVWHAGNDGSGSGLDADLLDGVHSSQFLRSDVDDTMSGVLNLNGYIQNNPIQGEWYSQIPHAYIGGVSSFKYIKIANLIGATTTATIEYIIKRDYNYPGVVKGTIQVSSYSSASMSVEHDQTTGNGQIDPQVFIDNNRDVWIRGNGAAWTSFLRWRAIQNSGVAILDGSTNQTTQPANSTIIPPGYSRKFAWNNAASYTDYDNTNTFKRVSTVDLTASNIGIGTTAPSQKLHISNGDVLADQTVAKVSLGPLGTNGDVHFGASGIGSTPAVGSQDYGFYAAHNAYRTSNGAWKHSRAATIPAVRLLGSGGVSQGNQGFSFDYSPNVGTADITWSNLMKILPSGNVGIGTTSPSEKLHVVSSNLGGTVNNTTTQAVFVSRNNNLSELHIQDYRTSAGGDWVSSGKRIQEKIDSTWMGYMQFNGTGNNAGISFGTGASTTQSSVTERMRIDENGNVGIGTTTDSGYRLNVSGNSRTTGNVVGGNFYNSGANYVFGLSTSEGEYINRTGNDIRFYAGGSARLTVDGDGGNVGIGTTSPTTPIHILSSTDIATFESSTTGLYNTYKNSNKVFGYVGTGSQTVSGGGANDFGIQSSDNFLIATGGNVERMRIDSAGRMILNGATSGTALSIRTLGSMDSLIRHEVSANPTGYYTLFGTNYSYNKSFVINNKGSEIVTYSDGTSIGLGLDGGASNLIRFSTNATERMRIDSSGNVGIGTTSPIADAKLVLHNADVDLEFSIDNAVGNTARIFAYDRATNTHRDIQLRGSQLTFYTGATEAMRIDGSGNVGIGTTSPAAKLQIYGAQPYIYITNTAENDAGIVFNDAQDTTGQAASIQFNCGSETLGFFVNDASTERVRIQTNGDTHFSGDVVAYSTSISDERLKDNIETIPNALDKVNLLRGVSYVWNEGSRKGQKDLGLIAQEVEKVLPEIVREKEMSLINDSGIAYKTIDYEKMVGVLIEAIKEQQQQIDELKKRLDGVTN